MIPWPYSTWVTCVRGFPVRACLACPRPAPGGSGAHFSHSRPAGRRRREQRANTSMTTPTAELDAAQALCCFRSQPPSPPRESTPERSQPAGKSPQPHAPRSATQNKVEELPCARRTWASTMVIVDRKHALWQYQLKHELARCRCQVTCQILQPALSLDPLSTAMHLLQLQPSELIKLEMTLRKIVVNVSHLKLTRAQT